MQLIQWEKETETSPPPVLQFPISEIVYQQMFDQGLTSSGFSGRRGESYKIFGENVYGRSRGPVCLEHGGAAVAKYPTGRHA